MTEDLPTLGYPTIPTVIKFCFLIFSFGLFFRICWEILSKRERSSFLFKIFEVFYLTSTVDVFKGLRSLRIPSFFIFVFSIASYSCKAEKKTWLIPLSLKCLLHISLISYDIRSALLHNKKLSFQQS